MKFGVVKSQMTRYELQQRAVSLQYTYKHESKDKINEPSSPRQKARQKHHVTTFRGDGVKDRKATHYGVSI